MSLRTRLDLTALEDRTVPAYAVVGVGQIADAAEGGTDGIIEFTRTSTIGSLPVSYTVSGTATSGTDYTALSGTVTFVNGSATVTVSVDALHDGLLDPGQTVTLAVASGSGYLIGINDSATISIIDTEVFPVASDDLVITPQNQSVNVSVIDLATSTVWDDTLTVTSVTQGSNGSVSLSGGTASYTPDSNFVGDDLFNYTVEDPFGNKATGTITVTVIAPQSPPTSVWTAQNTAVSVSVADLAFDPFGGTLTTTAVTQGSHGSVSIKIDGSVTYTPGSTFTGDDSFTYTVEDGNGNTATGTITVTVGTTDPVALDESVTTATNTAVVVAVPDLSYQPAGGSITTTSVTQGSHGSVSINGNGSVTYTPNSGYMGTDTFTYTVTDSTSGTAIGTITVAVGTVADPADEVTEDLVALQDEIDTYDADDPPNLTSAISALASSASGYTSGVNSLITTIDLGLNSVLRSVAVTGYLELLHGMNRLQTLYIGMDLLLLSTKSLTEDRAQSLKVALMGNNQALIMNLAGQYAVVNAAHESAKEVMRSLMKAMYRSETEAKKTLRALQLAYRDSAVVQNLPAPPVFTIYPMSRYTAKLP